MRLRVAVPVQGGGRDAEGVVTLSSVGGAQQRRAAAEERDDLADVEDHVRGVGVLHHLAVQARRNAQGVRIGDVFGCDQGGAERREGVEGLAAAPLAAASLHSGPMIVDFSRRFPPWRRRGHRISFPSRGCRHYRPLPLEFPGHSQNPSTGVLDCPIYLPACDSPGCSGLLHSTTTQPSADISTAGPIIPGWPASPKGTCRSTPDPRHSPSDSA